MEDKYLSTSRNFHYKLYARIYIFSDTGYIGMDEIEPVVLHLESPIKIYK